MSSGKLECACRASAGNWVETLLKGMGEVDEQGYPLKRRVSVREKRHGSYRMMELKWMV
jgi:hypothetical protein